MYSKIRPSASPAFLRTLRHRLSGHTLIGRVRASTDLVGCVLVAVAVGRGVP